MALMGLPSGSAGGDIKPRIQYDAKAGKWHRVDRHQGASGEWINDMFEMDKGDMFLMDFTNIEVGWIAFLPTGPDFQMVPNGTPVGPKPTEAHKPGFRISVVLPKEDTDRHFASTAKSVLGVIDELHTAAAANNGQVPVVKIAGTRVIETKGPQGMTRNYAPLLEIVKYVPRPAALGGAGKVETPAKAEPPPKTTAEAIGDEMPF